MLDIWNNYQLNIVDTEFDGDKQHFLYTETPRIVRSKIAKYLEFQIKPTITARDKERFERIAFEADVVIYPDKKNLDRANEVYDILTDAIAILAFVPGGIEMFGYRYEAKYEFDGES